MSKSYTRVSPDIAKEMIELRKKGYRVREIGIVFGRSHSTVVWHTNPYYRKNRQIILKRNQKK